MKKRRKPTVKNSQVEPSEPLPTGMETCGNPWNGVCENTDIELFIMYRDERIPICRECWMEIAHQDVEWRYD